MRNVIQLFQHPRRAPAPTPSTDAIKRCGTVVPLIHTKQAKAQGVFAEINIAARRMGFSDRFALEYARRARAEFNQGGRSPSRVISDWTATLRAVSRQVRA